MRHKGIGKPRRKLYRLFLRKFSEKFTSLRKTLQNGAAYRNRHRTMASPKLRKTQELTRYFQVHWVAFRAIGCSQVFSRKPEYRSGSDVPHGARAGALCSERMRRFPVARSWVRRHVPGFWRATRFGSNLLPRPGYVGNGLQCLVNRFRQSRHGCLFQQKCRARQY
jgi:hypothetical protein